MTKDLEFWLEVAVLVAAGWPAPRILAHPAVRSELRSRPELTVLVGVGGMTFIGFGVWIFSMSETAARLGTTLGALAAAAGFV